MRIRRDIHLNRLIASKHIGMIKVITGIRRCGKSYLLFNLFRDHLAECGVDDDHIIKIDLEDRRNATLRDPDNLLHHIDSKMTDKGMYYILLDEVQYVREFVDVLNSYMKIENADVYVTGSNSKFLSKDIVTEFRGRGYEIHIGPLSFSEFATAYQGTHEQALAEYLTYGGLPEVFFLPSERQKEDYLKGLFATTYLTDIKARYRITNDTELGEVVDVLASSMGGLVNPAKIENTFKSIKNTALSRNTIKSYLDILEEAFLVEKSVRYDIKGRKYICTPAKYYFSDLGLRNARLNFRQHEASHLMENMIYNELRLRGYAVDVGVVMTNTKDANGVSQRKQLEVDFVCNRGNKRCYVQSALRLPTEEKLAQELRPLNSVNDSFQKFVITEDPMRKHCDDSGVVFMNLYDFLLDADSLTV